MKNIVSSRGFGAVFHLTFDHLFKLNSVFNAIDLFTKQVLILFKHFYIRLIRFLQFYAFQISLISLKILKFTKCALFADLPIYCHNLKLMYRFDFEILVFVSQVKSSILL